MSYLHLAALKERGWTKRAVEKFLGECDHERPNPRFRNAAPMKMWALDAVQAAEQSVQFQEFQLKSAARSQAMKVVMQRKRVHTIETFTQALAREVDLVISKYRDRLEDLETESIRHRCEFHRDRGRDADMPDRADVDVDTRKRWVGNYVRHCLTTYDDLVDSSYGAVGRHEAYDAMKALVSQRVSLLYA